MASPRFARAEVWSGFQCAGGARQAVIGDLLAAEDQRAVSGEHRLSLALPAGSNAMSALTGRKVVRIVFADDTFEEWRVGKLWHEFTEKGALIARVEGTDPSLALGDVTIYRTEADGTHSHQFEALGLTAAQHLAQYVLPALAADGYTWVAAGTLDPTEPIDLVYDFSSALAVVRYLAEALGCEFTFRRNGSTQYLIDLPNRIGSSAPTRYVREGRDLLRLLRELDTAPMATRVIPKGADSGGLRATMADAEWVVTAITPNVDVTLADPLGGDGPLLEDDQLNGCYLLKTNGTLQAITDSVASTQKVLVASTTGITVGDKLRVRKTAGGERLDFLESPSQRAAFGLASKVLDRPDIPDTRNLLANPAMRVYTAASNAPPDNWRIIPGCGLAAASVDKETSAARWRGGGQSAKVVGAGDGQGIETDYCTLSPSAAQPYVSGFGSFWQETAGASVRVDLVLGKGAVSIASMTRATAGGTTTVTVNTSAAHGLASGALAEVLGVTGATTADGYNGVQLVTVVDTDTFTYQLPTDPGAITLSSATARQVWTFPDRGHPNVTVAAQRWVDLGFAGIDANALGATVAKVRVMQHGSTAATLYIDRAQITPTDTQRDFLEGNGATRLWQAANVYLRDQGPPAARYDVALLDLARLDGGKWANEDLALGQTIVAVHADFPGSPITTRVIDLRRNLLVEGEATAGLSTRPQDITDSMVRPRTPPRIGNAPNGAQELIPEAYFTFLPSLPTQVQVRLAAIPAPADLYYWLGEVGQSPPVVGQVSGGAPSATQWGTYTGAFTVNRIQAGDLLLYVYAVQGSKTSQVRAWTIDRDTTAAATLSLVQSSASAVRASWAPDVDVARVRVYGRRVASPGSVAWPTVDGTQAAQVSETYFLAELSVTVAGGGFDKNGSSLAGAVELVIDQSTMTAQASGAWANGDKAAVIAVPIDRFGNVGTRGEASLTFSSGTPALITSFSATRDDDGTACETDGCQFTLSWATSGVTGASHDLKLYYRYSVGGGSPSAWTLLTTIADPTSPTSYVWQSLHKKTTGKFDPTVSYEFKGELYNTVPTLIDSRQSAVFAFASDCEL